VLVSVSQRDVDGCCCRTCGRVFRSNGAINLIDTIRPIANPASVSNYYRYRSTLYVKCLFWCVGKVGVSTTRLRTRDSRFTQFGMALIASPKYPLLRVPHHRLHFILHCIRSKCTPNMPSLGLNQSHTLYTIGRLFLRCNGVMVRTMNQNALGSSIPQVEQTKPP